MSRSDRPTGCGITCGVMARQPPVQASRHSLFYFSLASLTTVGYGDATAVSQLLWLVWSLGISRGIAKESYHLQIKFSAVLSIVDDSIEKELRLLRQESRAAAPIEAAAARCWLVSILNSTPERSLLSSGCRLLCWHPVCPSNSARSRAHTQPVNFSRVPRVALGRRRSPDLHMMALIRTASQPAKGCTGHSRRNGGNLQRTVTQSLKENQKESGDFGFCNHHQPLICQRTVTTAENHVAL